MIKQIAALLTLNLLVVLCPLSSNEQKPFATCSLQGQLGNQLFMISATLAYAWEHDLEPIFPDLERQDLNIPINKEKIFFRLNATSLPRTPSTLILQPECFTYIELPDHAAGDVELEGLFQSWKYFDKYRDKILETFAPSDAERKSLSNKYAALLAHPMSVGIHVRTFNQYWHELAIPFVGLLYYIRAMTLFPDDALFVVFSDRINWCKRNFPVLYRNVVFIDPEDHVDDLYLMSMMKHNIIGNSTFSWWAAYLNNNPDKIVVAPKHFIYPQLADLLKSESNPNMPEWIELDHDLTIPYPIGMNQHDGASTSLDTQ